MLSRKHFQMLTLKSDKIKYGGKRLYHYNEDDFLFKF